MSAAFVVFLTFLERSALTFELDAYDRKILALLQQDGRLSYSEIGRRVHLTSPAIAERIRRLEEANIIQGFSARLNLRAIGYSFETFVSIVVDSHEALDAWAAAHPEVLALHATTGNHCALLRIAVRTPEHLESLLKSLGRIGKTSTSMVLSTQFEDRQRLPADEISAGW
jgi:Lrp/AsnC family leucine-responsive transcriptional regulator